MQASPFPLEALGPVPGSPPRLAPDLEDSPPGVDPAPASALRPAVVASAAPPPSWTAHLLAVDPAFSPRREALRFAAGLGLASLYGLALGVRGGGAGLIAHALGVPAALLVALGLGVPALYIALALFDVPLALPAVVASAARSAASAGLVLAGLAPAAALFVVTSVQPGAAALAAVAGLLLGGAVGLVRLVRELQGGVHGLAVRLVLVGFSVFAVTVADRIWWATLPVLRGGR